MSTGPLPAGPYLVAGLGQAGAAAIGALRAAPACERLVAWDASGAPGVHGGAGALRRRGVAVFSAATGPTRWRPPGRARPW